MKYEIRPALESDIIFLNENIPSSINAPQIKEQYLGHSIFLMALDKGKPVGRLVLRWDGSSNEVIRKLEPGVPNISMLRTREDNYGQGVGTSLMKTSEKLAEAKGYLQIGLSVALENVTAIRIGSMGRFYNQDEI